MHLPALRTVTVSTLALVLPLTLLHCNRSKGPAGGDNADGGSAVVAPAATPDPATASLAFLSSFEGEIDVTMTSKSAGAEGPTAVAVLVKNGKVRFDVPAKLTEGTPFGPNAYALLDLGAKKASLVSDARKQVIVLDLNTSGETFKGLGTPPPRPGNPSTPAEPKTTLTKTGKVDTVAGYKCEYWDVASNHKEATVCVAEQGASWFHLPLTGIPTERMWMAELMDGKHFPLRVIAYDQAGTAETGRLEVTKIDKRSLADNKFEYPPTYQVMDLGQMLGGLGMGGMPGGPGGTPPGMPHHRIPGMPPGMPPAH